MNRALLVSGGEVGGSLWLRMRESSPAQGEQVYLGPFPHSVCVLYCEECGIFLKEAGVSVVGVVGKAMGLFSLQEKPVAASLRGVGTARLELW